MTWDILLAGSFYFYHLYYKLTYKAFTTFRILNRMILLHSTSPKMKLIYWIKILAFYIWCGTSIKNDELVLA